MQRLQHTEWPKPCQHITCWSNPLCKQHLCVKVPQWNSFPNFASEKGVSLGEFPLEAGPCRNWSLLSKVEHTGLGSTTFFSVIFSLQCHRLISATLMMQSHGISSSQICVEKHVFKIQQWSHASKQTLSWPGSKVTVLFAFNTHCCFSHEYHPNLSQLRVLQKIMFVLSAAFVSLAGTGWERANTLLVISISTWKWQHQKSCCRASGLAEGREAAVFSNHPWWDIQKKLSKARIGTAEVGWGKAQNSSLSSLAFLQPNVQQAQTKTEPRQHWALVLPCWRACLQYS